MDLAQLVQTTLQEITDEGVVKKIVRTQLEKTVTDLSRNLMSEYSDFGKKLNTRISESLDIDLGPLDLETYKGIISKEVESILLQTAYAPAIADIKKIIEQVTGTIEKRTYTLSEIVDSYKKQVRLTESNPTEINFSINQTNYGHTWVELFYNGKYSKNEKYDFGIDSKTGAFVLYLENGRQRNPILHPSFSEFELLLFKLWNTQAIINLDEENVNTYFYND